MHRTLFVTSIFSAALLAAILPATPTAAVTLTLTPPTANENTFDLEVIAGLLSDTDTTTGSGTIEVDFGYASDVSGYLNSLEFTGGQIDFGSLSWSLGFGLLTINGTGVAGELDTLNPPSNTTLISDNGTDFGFEYDATEHQLTVDQGLFISSGLANQTIDISSNPFGGPGSGLGSIDLVEVSQVGNDLTYDVTLTLPIAFVGRVQDTANGDPINVDLDMNGLIKATGQWTLSLSFPDPSGDGFFGLADLNILGANFGTMGGATLMDGDLNGDGNVDLSDLNILGANWNPPPPAVSVPEPASGLLLCLSLPLGLVRRYNSSSC